MVVYSIQIQMECLCKNELEILEKLLITNNLNQQLVITILLMEPFI